MSVAALPQDGMLFYIKQGDTMNWLNEYSAFLTCVYNNDSADIKNIEHLLESIPPECDDPWIRIGYNYLSVITKLFHNDSKGTHLWVNQIIEAVKDPYNNVFASVETGITLWNDTVARLGLSFDYGRYLNAVVDYLENALTPVDRDLFQSLKLKNANNEEYRPINYRGTWNVGIVNPWPGDMSAEAEVLSRMKVGAEDAGIQLTMLSNFGHILDPVTQKKTDDFVDADEVDFIISTHYDTHKCIDSFYYHTLWNPPEIPLNLDEYTGYVTNNYVMNDDYLIYDDGGMSTHLKCMLMNSPRNLNGASSLTASFPQSRMLKPKLDDPKMFYCGMNWERVVHNANRHEGLFKLLDETGKVKFFGPEKVAAWGGIRPWDGYKCYQYSIPFDGFSILKEINECGICLVLSSDIHRRAGAATNRTYEACAAGAVIISDDNPFMLKHFKDAALFIQYNKNDPQDTFKQLMEKYQWVIDHKEEALRLAQNAQNIFVEKFAVDLQLKNILNNHANCVNRAKKSLFATDEKKVVLATFVVNTQSLKKAIRLLKPVVTNIKKQYYRNIQLAIAADESIAKNISKYCKKQLYSTKVVSLPLFDFKKSRKMTDAEALDKLYSLYPHDYFINIRGEEVWFSDHITTLVRRLQESGEMYAYSGRLFEDKFGYRRTDMFRKLAPSTIYYMNCPDWMPVPGQILFTAECHGLYPKEMSPFLDGMEHYALMDLLTFKHQQSGDFSRRMSFNYIDGRFDERSSVVPDAMQIRIIRDSVKYDLPSNAIGGVASASAADTMRIMSYMPLKLWISVRLTRALLRVLPSHSLLYKKISSNYQKKLEALVRFTV